MHFVHTGFQKNIINFSIPAIIKGIKRHFGYDVRIIRMDAEQSLSADVLNWIAGEETLHFEQSSEYLHEQNGDIERAGRTLMEKARCMRLHAGLPEKLWPEVFQCAAYLSNCTPTRSLSWQSPLTCVQQCLIRDQKQVRLPESSFKLSHVVAYGCRAYVNREYGRSWDKFAKSAKLESRALIGYLVGYDSTNVFRIWVPSKNTIVRTRDVQFNENFFFTSASQKDELTVSELDDVIERVALPDSLRSPVTIPVSSSTPSAQYITFLDNTVPSQSQPRTPTPALPTPEPTPQADSRNHGDSGDVDDIIQSQLADDMARWSAPPETQTSIDTHPVISPTPPAPTSTDLPGAIPGETPSPAPQPQRRSRQDGIDPANIIQGPRTRRSN